jgi:hypothetical protein
MEGPIGSYRWSNGLACTAEEKGRGGGGGGGGGVPAHVGENERGSGWGAMHGARGAQRHGGWW